MSDKKECLVSNEVRSLARYAIQKTLASDCSKFFLKEVITDLNKKLLSSNPETDFDVTLHATKNIDLELRRPYDDSYLTINVQWPEVAPERVDEDGNLWKTHAVKVSVTVQALYKRFDTKSYAFEEFIEAVNAADILATELNSLTTSPITACVMDNNARIERDRKERTKNAVDAFEKAIHTKNREIRRKLRTGGSSRDVPRHLVEDFDQGTYKITINDGSYWNGVLKTYELTVPSKSDSLSVPTIRRVK